LSTGFSCKFGTSESTVPRIVWRGMCKLQFRTEAKIHNIEVMQNMKNAAKQLKHQRGIGGALTSCQPSPGKSHRLRTAALLECGSCVTVNRIRDDRLQCTLLNIGTHTKCRGRKGSENRVSA